MSLTTDKPTRTRFVVLAYLCALTFILYLDRVCFGQAMTDIRTDLDLTKAQMSYVLVAFMIAYGVFELPVGHWGDRIGSRAVLTRIAICWSFFTALTAGCLGLWSLLMVRFLFGAGEAGALPNTARVVVSWFPTRERGRVSGLIQTTMVLGGAAAPVGVAYLIKAIDWRWTFILFGLIGVVWSVAFWLWFRDDPAQHPGVNRAELALLQPGGHSGQTQHASIPWKAVLRNRSIWTLGTIMTFAAFNTYVYYSWFPTYLQEGREVEKIESGWLSSLVLAGAALGTISGGFLTDLLSRHCSDQARARRWQGSIAFSVAAGSLWLGMQFDSARLTALMAAVSCFALASTLSSWWACVMEISGRHLGALFGLMNSMGLVGGMASQYFFGVFPDWREAQGYSGRAQWDPAFTVVMVGLLLAALGWACYSSHPVKGESQVEHAAHQP